MNDDLPGMPAVAKGVAEQRWPHTMDAAVWAAEFVKLHPGADEADMIGWFANAIMAGYDTAQSKALRPEVGSNVNAARYRWLNKQHNFLVYIEDEKQTRTNVRLRCGVPLDEWIDNRIAEEAEPQR